MLKINLRKLNLEPSLKKVARKKRGMGKKRKDSDLRKNNLNILGLAIGGCFMLGFFIIRLSLV
jgi:hypothetical protein